MRSLTWASKVFTSAALSAVHAINSIQTKELTNVSFKDRLPNLKRLANYTSLRWLLQPCDCIRSDSLRTCLKTCLRTCLRTCRRTCRRMRLRTIQNWSCSSQTHGSTDRSKSGVLDQIRVEEFVVGQRDQPCRQELYLFEGLGFRV